MLLALAACEDDPVAPPSGLVQNFNLRDENPNSFTAGDDVSPRQHIGQISAWYFGHAT